MSLNPVIDEKELVERLRQGDERAFTHLYGIYSDRIYTRLLRLMATADLAKEILQDTFVTLWEKRQTLNPELPIKAWIYKVAENKVYQLYRKIGRDTRLQQHILENFTELYSHTEEDLHLKESRLLLQQAIEQLSPQRRKVFELCRIEGKSYEETARILGLSVPTVSNYLVKATELVRKYMFRSDRTAVLLFTAWLIDR
ncbi:MAG: sigma-70 family RNA polymerase sigma factor [Pseudosphingobacterium sp.]|nr:sigma-70 family RNA polymerase sigma factor [Pseudosphingobacterium sp.]